MTIIFEERAPYEQGFAAHYAATVAPEIENLEKLRQKFLNYFYLVLGAGICIAILALPYLDTLEDKNFDAIIVYTFIAGGLLLLVMKQFKSNAKNILAPLIMTFYKNKIFTAGGFISGQHTTKFNILPSFDHYKGEDLCTKEDFYQSCELKLTQNRGSGKNRRTVTTFQGLALLITLPYTVHAPTRLCMDKGKVGNWLSNIGKPTGDTVGLEDPVFEKIFEVYSTDQIEARRILTPTFMEKLLSLNALIVHWKKNGEQIEKFLDVAELKENPDQINNDIAVSFLGNEVLVLIDCRRDLFEPASLFKPSNDTAAIRCMLLQFHLIEEIYKTLCLAKPPSI